MEDDKLVRAGRADTARMYFDFYKHLTTLNTGSLLLLVTFLEKFAKGAQYKWILMVAFSGFIISLLSALLAMFMGAGFVRQDMDRTEAERSTWAIFAMISLAAFFAGIFFLSFFALINLS